MSAKWTKCVQYNNYGKTKDEGKKFMRKQQDGNCLDNPISSNYVDGI